MDDLRIVRYCKHDDVLDCGGIVLANNIDDAKQKLLMKYGTIADEMELWYWNEDCNFDSNNQQVLEIY